MWPEQQVDIMWLACGRILLAPCLAARRLAWLHSRPWHQWLTPSVEPNFGVGVSAILSRILRSPEVTVQWYYRAVYQYALSNVSYSNHSFCVWKSGWSVKLMFVGLGGMAESCLLSPRSGLGVILTEQQKCQNGTPQNVNYVLNTAKSNVITSHQMTVISQI